MRTRSATEAIFGHPITDAQYIELLERAVDVKDGVVMGRGDKIREHRAALIAIRDILNTPPVSEAAGHINDRLSWSDDPRMSEFARAFEQVEEAWRIAQAAVGGLSRSQEARLAVQESRSADAPLESKA